MRNLDREWWEIDRIINYNGYGYWVSHPTTIRKTTDGLKTSLTVYSYTEKFLNKVKEILIKDMENLKYKPYREHDSKTANLFKKKIYFRKKEVNK
ncbi:hypothetical protein DRJ17_05710 [Candidatus Woesearchaeota archaeon]|nr:MAG: hypothetical protein DRJ17_05710 [Candidatus Woesearchaeota archaeon]